MCPIKVTRISDNWPLHCLIEVRMMPTSAFAFFRTSPLRFRKMCTMGGFGAPLPISFSHGVTSRSPTGSHITSGSCLRATLQAYGAASFKCVAQLTRYVARVEQRGNVLFLHVMCQMSQGAGEKTVRYTDCPLHVMCKYTQTSRRLSVSPFS